MSAPGIVGDLRFRQVDVFSGALGQGNPVAVVHDADDLDEETMAMFARWTNLSETTFLLRPRDSAADYRVRIFTPGGELPFAGHPTLGTARAWLDVGGRAANPSMLVQECGVGLVRVRRDGSRLSFAAPPLLRSGPVAREEVEDVAMGLGVDTEDVIDAQWCDNGPGWVALLLRSAEAVLRVDAGTARFGEHDKVGLIGPHALGHEAAFEVRAFFPGGVGEDPVTGSLNAALAQWLISTGRAPHRYVASQGTQLDRMGRVHVEHDGRDVWVGGETVVGVRGQVALAAPGPA